MQYASDLSSAPVYDRMRGAWLGLFAAEQVAASSEPPADMSQMPVSMAVMEARLTIEALATSNTFDIDRISKSLIAMEREFPDADFSHASEDDGGLLRCLAVSMWFRSKPLWRVLEALECCLDISSVGDRGRIATLALCFWARELHDERRNDDPWQDRARSWAKLLVDAGYAKTEVAAILQQDPPDARQDDLAILMVRQLRACIVAESLEGCVRSIADASHQRPALIAAGGFLFGLARGAYAIPVEWSGAISNAAGFEDTLRILLDKKRHYSSLLENINITSINCPLVLSPVECLQGRFLLTTSPGAGRNLGFSDRGRVDVRRDMSLDVARIRAGGATHLLTLLRGDELMDAEMTSLRMVAEAGGVQWLHLPIIEGDLSKPYFEQDLSELLPVLKRALDAGGSIAVHAHDWRGRLQTLMPKLLGRLDDGRSETDNCARVEAAIMVGLENDHSMELA